MIVDIERNIPPRREPAPAARSRLPPVEPPSVARPVAKFVVAGLIAVLAFGIGSLLVLRELGRREAINEARAVATLAAQGIVEPNLEQGLLSGDPKALARLDYVVRARVLSDRIVRVKIWSPAGVILYSDEPRVVGDRYSLGHDELEALRDGAARAELSDLEGRENRFERGQGELLEVYTRIRAPDGSPLLVELYQRFDSVVSTGRRVWLSFAVPLVAALVLLWLVQVPLAYSMARRLRDGHREREMLLRRTLDASDDERRRISADLHDGVVQDLAGISYSLDAAAEGAGRFGAHPGKTLRQAADGTRDSMRRIRSLLLDIHPANLRASGLRAAIADVLAPLRGRGIRTSLEVPDDLDLDSEAEALLFRAAREAVRNADEHAGAQSVRVRIERDQDRVRLLVEDDGLGFEPEVRERRRREGHVGLSLLEELASTAGGSVDVRSDPGRGTTLTLEVETE